MLKFLWEFIIDEHGATLAITRKTANTLATAAGINTNFAEIEAVVNALTSDNISADAVGAAALNSDVVRSGYGLVQHTDGSLYVDVSDTNPGLEISDGGLRAKVYGLASRTSNGIDIGRSGDLLLSSSATTPDGWTDVSATYADKMIRISATALSTGGSDTLAGNTASTTLTAAQSGLPAHIHTAQYGDNLGGGDTNDTGVVSAATKTGSGYANTESVSAANAAEGHVHALTSVACVPAYMTSKMFLKS